MKRLPLIFVLILALCAVGSAQETQKTPETRASLPLQAVSNGPRGTPKIALTFDACPAHDMKVDWNILNALIATQTKATLFLSGQWMEKFPEETKKIASLPQFELALHGYSHPHMTSLAPEAIRENLKKAQEVLKNLTGRTAAYFRAPYGEYDQKVLEAARDEGLTTIQFEVVSGDPSPTVGKKALFNRVVGQTKNGSIIIMHVNGRGRHTAEALPDILQALKAKGFEFVTVSELLAGGSK